MNNFISYFQLVYVLGVVSLEITVAPPASFGAFLAIWDDLLMLPIS